MTINTNDMLNSILESISRIDYIHPEDIPNIDLYMDQVTTFMDAQLASTKRYHEDKILTKNHDQQLRQEQSPSSPCQEEVHEGACACLDFYLLF